MTRKQPPDDFIVTITYLEMDAPPRGSARPTPDGAFVMRAHKPTRAFYRFLYDTVGDPWWWLDRRQMDQDALTAIIQDDRVEVHVLYWHGAPAGYLELDYRQAPEVNIAYFGLMPEYIGLGLGRWFLEWGVQEAWTRGAAKLTVNTCNLDHEAALPLYQKVGFRPVRQAQKTFAAAPG